MVCTRGGGDGEKGAGASVRKWHGDLGLKSGKHCKDPAFRVMRVGKMECGREFEERAR